MICDLPWLDRIPVPSAAEGTEVATVSVGGRVGARVVARSRHAPEAWSPVLHAPELADSWLPPAFGVGRAERLDATHMYQAVDMPFLGGMLHFRRQMVVSIDWLADGQRVRTCWTALEPAPWLAQVAQWNTGAPWQWDTMGGWDVEPLPGGGSRVSYQVWASDRSLVPGLQEWAMSRTLPELLALYEARITALH